MTIVEMLIAVLLFGVATAAVLGCFVAALRVYAASRSRYAVHREAAKALREVTEDLRCASSASVSSGGARIDFKTPRYSGWSYQSYCYLLYNSSNPPPNPPFTQAEYVLVRVPVAAATPQLGSAVIIARSVSPPAGTTPVFSIADTPTPPPATPTTPTPTPPKPPKPKPGSSPTPSPSPGPSLISINLSFAKDSESVNVRTNVMMR